MYTTPLASAVDAYTGSPSELVRTISCVGPALSGVRRSPAPAESPKLKPRAYNRWVQPMGTRPYWFRDCIRFFQNRLADGTNTCVGVMSFVRYRV